MLWHTPVPVGADRGRVLDNAFWRYRDRQLSPGGELLGGAPDQYRIAVRCPRAHGWQWGLDRRSRENPRPGGNRGRRHDRAGSAGHQDRAQERIRTG